MRIIILGNPDEKIDSLPVRLYSRLCEIFPNFQFEIKDPNEEWSLNDSTVTIIDTVLGINEVREFTNLNDFTNSPRISMHGYDALFNLKLLKKLGKISRIKIIGIPPTISENEAIEQIKTILY